MDHPCRYWAQKWRSSPRPQRGLCTRWPSGRCGSGAPGPGWPGAGADTVERCHHVTDNWWYLLITQMWGAGVDKVGENQEERVANSLLVRNINVRHKIFWNSKSTKNISRSVKLGFRPSSPFFLDRIRMHIKLPLKVFIYKWHKIYSIGLSCLKDPQSWQVA